VGRRRGEDQVAVEVDDRHLHESGKWVAAGGLKGVGPFTFLSANWRSEWGMVGEVGAFVGVGVGRALDDAPSGTVRVGDGAAPIRLRIC